MFLGTHYPRLDDKGRFVLPAKFREALGEGVVISRGQEHCLYVFTPDGFQDEAARELSGSMSSRSTREYQRFYASGASEEVPDKQGRLTVPPLLRRYAGLDKEIAVVGAYNRVEIWDRTAWEEFEASSFEKFAELDSDVNAGRIADA
ncbi:MAG TPA: division/cell wall cluster transcriptional repressor MraZ [Propioniciclava tarda]|nr:division/cell wall cluster transcriptional repressor MraZ [Propioniciclava tarda]HQD60046.1 division/cell wall cluster transcriptional repressor MraZ [Propioniciclava tarda]